MEVDQLEQMADSNGQDTRNKDNAIHNSKEHTKDDLIKGNEENEGKESYITVGNRSCDIGSNKHLQKMSSGSEANKTNNKWLATECVMNGNTEDHSDTSSNAEVDKEIENNDEEQGCSMKKASHNGATFLTDVANEDNLKINIFSAENIEQTTGAKNNVLEKHLTELDPKSMESYNKDKIITSDDKNGVDTSKETSNSCNMKNNTEDDNEFKESKPACEDFTNSERTSLSKNQTDEEMPEVQTSNEAVENENKKEEGEADEYGDKLSNSEDCEITCESENDKTKQSYADKKEEHETYKKDNGVEQIEIDDNLSNCNSKNNKSIGDLLPIRHTVEPETSLIGNPPFISVTYSARGPVPVTSTGNNNLRPTSSSVKMVVPTMKTGLTSQARPQFQNQFQFYLQAPSVNVNNNNQNVGVLNIQSGAESSNCQFSNRQDKIEPPHSPQSSMDMIELSRWEVKQGLHRRARNTKIRPESELSNLARFLRDFGQDLVKEAVYSDLVKIQQKRNLEGKLKTKEAEDFKKLKSVHQELREKVGPCKVQLNKKCSCGFKTESTNVMYAHKQHPHIDGYDMCCAYCSFVTRNTHVFRFHLEGEHNVKPVIEMKPPLWECNLCPYEHNIKNKLTQHKFKCTKNFKLHLNLHPAWMPGPETNFCLENLMYKFPAIRMPSPQIFNKQTIRPQFKAIGQRLPAPRIGDTVQQINTARSQHTMKFGGQRPGIAPNVNFFQQRPSQIGQNNARTTLRNVSATLTPNHPGFQLNRMPTPTAMPPLLQKQQIRSQMPKVSMGSAKSTPSTANVTSKINHLITLNDQVLDMAAKGQPSTGFEICEICGGYVKDRTALRIHFFYAHRIDMPYAVFERIHPPLYCATCFSRFWTAQGLQKHLDIHKEDSSGGVAGKCVVCGHRVPNILMHMRIVHNKALNNFLKECKCIFCGTSFQNKTIVENHMAAIHGVVVKSGNPVDSSSAKLQRPAADKTGTSSQKSGTALVKGSVCVLCNLNFGRNVDLTRHCMKVHHTCMKCGMVVADKLSLLKHTCLESPAGLRNCELCGEKGFHPAYHVKHIRDKHLKKCSVKICRMSVDKRQLSQNIKSVIDEIIDVDSRPTPAKKYKAARPSKPPESNSQSNMSSNSKKRLTESENNSEDEANKPGITAAKKARTIDENKKMNDIEDKNKHKAEISNVIPNSSKQEAVNDESTNDNEKDTSEQTADISTDENKASSQSKLDRISVKNHTATESSNRKLKTLDGTNDTEIKSAKSDNSSKQDQGNNSSSDEGEGSAFCGFQSLTKPDKNTNIDSESGGSESD